MNNELVKIVNLHQVDFYKGRGVEPVDSYIGYKNKRVYLFKISETKDIFKLWRKKHLEYLDSQVEIDEIING